MTESTVFWTIFSAFVIGALCGAAVVFFCMWGALQDAKRRLGIELNFNRNYQ